VVRVRRQYTNGSWAEYTLPIDIQDAKSADIPFVLKFELCWYKLERSARGVKWYYRYGVQDTNEVSLDDIICPVALKYEHDNQLYVLMKEQVELIALNRGGVMEWSA
jgi:hypothetical protein